MSKAVTGEKRRNGRVWFILLCVLAFLVSFAASAVFKLVWKDPALKKYSVQWSDQVGTVHADLPYGEKPANRFDLYVPADNTGESYGLAVYLHAGGFTSGDKTDDVEMLQWLCSLGYVSAGINYTLFSKRTRMPMSTPSPWRSGRPCRMS